MEVWSDYGECGGELPPCSDKSSTIWGEAHRTHFIHLVRQPHCVILVGVS
jgi:hypothetical protein